MRTLKIATAQNRFSKKWKNREVTWEWLLGKLHETKRTEETFAEYLAMSHKAQQDVKDVGGFVGGHLREGKRKNGHVLSRSLVCLDIDYADETLWRQLDDWIDFKTLAYTTHKHSPQKPRVRIVVPLTRDVSEEEYAPLGRRIAQQIGIDLFDDTSYEASRLMFYPSTALDGQYRCEEYGKDWLDPDMMLGLYDDWTDATTWPLSSRQAKAPVSRGRAQEDPLSKTGLVGAFCRAYTIREALDEFLPGAYEPAGSENRLTYTGGESVGGAIIYGDKWLYSHHNTDPTSGQLVNAFDLVRLHKFGDMDEVLAEDIPTSQLASYKAMSEFATGLEKVRLETFRETISHFDPFDDKWLGRLEMTKNGICKPSLSNLVLILENDRELAGVAFDELKGAIVATRLLPWARPAVAWRDVDDAHLAVYLEKRYVQFSERDLKAALSHVADKRKFHPIRQFFEELPAWDGVGRVDSLLIDYLGAEDCEYVRAVTRKLLCAAVRRIKQPGCKFDTMLILAGPQGIGKSTLIARLAGQWFNDSLSLADTKDKTAAEKLQGFWIQEFGELAGMRKAETEALRSFISRQDDTYRAAYAKRVESHPRQCVFIGTTNAENGFLTDPAGNRRMWPVNVSGATSKRAWDISDAEVNQVWAEALVKEKEERLYLTGDLAAEAAKRQKAAIEVDERIGLVAEYLDTPLPANWAGMDVYGRISYLQGAWDESKKTENGPLVPRSHVSVVEVWCECFGKPKADLRRGDSYVIANMLKRLGWECGNKSIRVKPYGVQKAFYAPWDGVPVREKV
ncbi:virulence-associated E family protein [Schaalia sp. lx-100]|uniref:virulence-associated E family protein n=1 Tax=Schaalia sp. lx-100 TaxID=2899081 RepID=UPI001E2E1A9F|nr:virulence-associated E family protein [Schaalia sp. lx-100]MCD4557189.1 virulence-associated E family protein [Schaalia sp. lx-100]